MPSRTSTPSEPAEAGGRGVDERGADSTGWANRYSVDCSGEVGSGGFFAVAVPKGAMGMGWAVAWMMASAVGAQPGEKRIAPRNAWVVSAPSPSSARIDPSGLTRVGEHLVVVSDKAHLPSLYRLVFVDQRQARMEVWRARKTHPN